MEKQKFDVFWKIGLMVILLVAVFYMFYEYKQISREGLTCIQSPFEWGKMKAQEQGLYCSYQCSNTKPYEINLTNFTGYP
jgi:hypothetical protein